MDESRWLYLATSNDLHHLEELKPFLTGSKIVFKRLGYWHTGVLLNKTNGKIIIIELEKSNNSVFRLKI